MTTDPLVKLSSIKARIAFYRQHFPSAQAYSEPGTVLEPQLQAALDASRLPLYIEPRDFIDEFGLNRTQAATESTAASYEKMRMHAQAAHERIAKFMGRRVVERRGLLMELCRKSAALAQDWHGRCRKREAEWGEPEDLGMPINSFPTPAAIKPSAASGHTIGLSAHHPQGKTWLDALCQKIPDQYSSVPSNILPQPQFRQTFPAQATPNNPPNWSASERKIFIQMYLQFPKNFSRISAALPYKTCEQCVQFYYLHKKEYRLKQMVVAYRRAMVAQRKLILNAPAPAAQPTVPTVPTVPVVPVVPHPQPTNSTPSTTDDPSSYDSTAASGAPYVKTGRPVGRPKKNKE